MKFEAGLIAYFYGVDNTRFKLDSHVFEVLEDENDGYRSCLGSIEVIDIEGSIFFQTPIAKIRVEDGQAGQDRYYSFDGYSLVDVEDGHVWLQVGTENYDDYYPSFVFDYFPKEATSEFPQ